jgi:hypothetical protein
LCFIYHSSFVLRLFLLTAVSWCHFRPVCGFPKLTNDTNNFMPQLQLAFREHTTLLPRNCRWGKPSITLTLKNSQACKFGYLEGARAKH